MVNKLCLYNKAEQLDKLEQLIILTRMNQQKQPQDVFYEKRCS